jgi:hypothetical protein
MRLVAESAQGLGIFGPVFLNAHKQLQKHLGCQQLFDFFAGRFSDLFEFGASFPDDNAFLGVPFNVDGCLDRG